MAPSRQTTGLAVLVLLVASAGLVAVVDRPRIQSVDNDWGSVTPERTEIVTDNPLPLRIGDGVADVPYNVSMNGVRVGCRTAGPAPGN